MASSQKGRVLPLTREIKPIGTFLDVDGDGFIVKAASLSAITPAWRILIDDAVQAFVERFREALHSVYIRGSVATGTAVRGVSDLDLLAIVLTPGFEPRSEQRWTGRLKNRLVWTFPYVSNADLSIFSLETVMATKPFQIVIQTQAVCVHGRDLSAELPRFRVGREMSYRVDLIQREIEASMERIEHTEESAQRIAFCVWIMKRIVRTAFELVMEREHRYTRDLYLCYEAFSKYYPAREAEMYGILDLAIHPTSDRLVVLETLRECLAWLPAEISAVFGPEPLYTRALQQQQGTAAITVSP